MPPLVRIHLIASVINKYDTLTSKQMRLYPWDSTVPTLCLGIRTLYTIFARSQASYGLLQTARQV